MSNKAKKLVVSKDQLYADAVSLGEGIQRLWQLNVITNEEKEVMINGVRATLGLEEKGIDKTIQT